MKLLLEDITVYTITGRKHLYKLGDMAYGQWLIFKDKNPTYYLDIFDPMYNGVNEIKRKDPVDYLEKNSRARKPATLFHKVSVDYGHPGLIPINALM